jgi:hypothetical protein
LCSFLAAAMCISPSHQSQSLQRGPKQTFWPIAAVVVVPGKFAGTWRLHWRYIGDVRVAQCTWSLTLSRPGNQKPWLTWICVWVAFLIETQHTRISCKHTQFGGAVGLTLFHRILKCACGSFVYAVHQCKVATFSFFQSFVQKRFNIAQTSSLCLPRCYAIENWTGPRLQGVSAGEACNGSLLWQWKLGTGLQQFVKQELQRPFNSVFAGTQKLEFRNLSS